MNVNRLTDPAYPGQNLPASVCELLQQHCIQQGFEMLREKVFHGAVLAPLRRLLRRLGLPVWAESTVGNS